LTLHIRRSLPTENLDPLIEDVLAGHAAPAPYSAWAKRLFDIAAVLAGALPALLVTLVFAVLVARDGHNPFYRQTRVGRNDRTFGMWKLRSMVPDADRLLQAHLDANPEAQAEWERDQKLRNDPRITRIGRLIRKTSIDELPQLWNVLKGDMSLVGPRPMMPDQRALYPGTAYYCLRPGITGYWQTSVRNESSFAERSGYDSAYLRDLSLITDLRILARTLRVVMKATGH
jgi:exopolysaccharide production protein ExoY